MSQHVEKHDYLAVVFIGAGSSYGRSGNKEVAIENCMRALKDWGVYYKLEGHKFTVNVMDVNGWDTVAWDDRGFWGKNPGDAKATKLELSIEQIERVYPEKKKRKR
jgi:hypothetical protein